MEYVFALLVIGLPIAYYARREYLSPGSVQPVNVHNGVDYGRAGRKCLACGYEGKMKTWLANYSVPQFIAIIGLIAGFLLGLVFIAMYWGKYKCPSCGAVGKNKLLSDAAAPTVEIKQEVVSGEKNCPYCAEPIKKEAVYCRYCQKDLGAVAS